MGGSFTDAGGNSSADHIARWDGATWQALDTGLNERVRAIAVSGSDVYVGGWFTDAGGNPTADHIARWEGGTWQALGTGLNNLVRAIAVSGSYVYVGGYFTDAGGNPNADYIARWEGGTWQALGTGLIAVVEAIAVSGSDVYVGGWFTDAGGNPDADYIARWDGATWQALDTGLNYSVHALTVDWCDLYVGGGFMDAGGNPNADYIARYGPIECRFYLPMIQKCPCVDIIVNNGFEDNSGWVIPTTEYPAGYTTDLFRTGNRSMRTGITKSSHNKYSYSAFRQMVEIPAGATATLTAHLWRMSEEPDATHIPLPENWYGTDLAEGSIPDGYPLPPGDVQYLLILDEDMEWIDTLIWQRKDAHEWTKKIYDLSGYAGKTIYIHFGTYNDGEDGISSLHVDDVTLVICP
ncbi:MAG: hypothetical protein U9R58_05075 [Chloroflexota bacterium]|nr:hypothetical protein [Chloroflexota bacterium]